MDCPYGGKARLIADDPPQTRPEDVADRPVQVADELHRPVASAMHEITIVSAYVIPTSELADALRVAVTRGVRVCVRLLTNSINSNNHVSTYAAYRGHIRELLGLVAEVHEVRAQAQSTARYIFPPILRKNLGLHAKYIILDGRRMVAGSANLDPRSRRINTEMVLVVDSAPLARKLSALTEPDFEESYA